MQDEDGIGGCREGSIPSFFKMRVIIRKCPAGLFQSSALLSGGEDADIQFGESAGSQCGFKAFIYDRASCTGRFSGPTAAAAHVFQCALERDPAPQHLGGIVEEMLFVS